MYWFCHTSTWIYHGRTRVPHPEPPSHLPPPTIPLGHPSAKCLFLITKYTQTNSVHIWFLPVSETYIQILKLFIFWSKSNSLNLSRFLLAHVFTWNKSHHLIHLYYLLNSFSLLISFTSNVLIVVVVRAAQSCLTLCDPLYSSPPGFTVHGILQARILEWVAIFFSRASSQPKY